MNAPRRIRLCLFTDSLEPSGVGRVMELLAHHLPKRHYEIFLACADHPGADRLAAGMSPFVSDIARHTVHSYDDIPALPALVDRLRRWRIDIFHNHIGITWEGDWGTVAARCATVPLVVATEHHPCVLDKEHEREHRRGVNQLLDRIFTVSDSVRESLIRDHMAPAETIRTVENG